MALRRQGCDLKIVADSVACAEAICAFGREHGEIFDVWIEVDVDGHRSGVAPDDDLLIVVGKALQEGGMRVGGVLAHAGSSYEYDTHDALVRIAEQERSGCVRAAERLRASDLSCDVVSIGSTPTALSAEHLEGVTEVRAGVYVMFDLVMHNVGVNETSDIALSVLTTVIGHQEEKGWAMVDAGWMAMSRDRGPQRQKRDFGYGLVCTESGDVLGDYVMSRANQEHGRSREPASPIMRSAADSLSARDCAFCPTMRARRARNILCIRRSSATAALKRGLQLREVKPQTGFRTARPSSTAATLSSAVKPIWSRVSIVALAICGVRNTLSSPAKRLSTEGSFR